MTTTSHHSDNSDYTSSGILIVPQRDDFTTKEVESSDIGNGDGCGWSWSASRYSLEKLEKCRHDYELTEVQQQHQSADTTQPQTEQEPSSSSVYVHVDRYMSGVGGYDSWSPNINEQYMVYPHNDMKIKIFLQPYETTQV